MLRRLGTANVVATPLSALGFWLVGVPLPEDAFELLAPTMPVLGFALMLAASAWRRRFAPARVNERGFVDVCVKPERAAQRFLDVILALTLTLHTAGAMAVRHSTGRVFAGSALAFIPSAG